MKHGEDLLTTLLMQGYLLLMNSPGAKKVQRVLSDVPEVRPDSQYWSVCL